MLVRPAGASAWWDAGRATRLLLGLGALLRLWQYLGNPGLWLDELAVANNLLTRPLSVLLTQPLADGQVAPPGFLVVSRAIVVTFGSSEYALRLFPILCSLASLVVFARIAARVLPASGTVLAVALFALSPGVAFYAAEAKQYAGDILVALVLTELALRWLEAPDRRRAAALTVGGAVGPFFSQPAVLVLAGLGAALLLGPPRQERRRLTVPLASWCLAGALSVALARSRMSSGLSAFMQAFWRDGFPPRPLPAVEAVLWPGVAVKEVFELALGYPWAWVYFALAVLGAVALFRRTRSWGLVMTAPLLVTLGAAMAHVYPFRLRLIMFLVPALLVLVAGGATWVAQRFRHRALTTALLTLVAAPVIVDVVRNPPVWTLDEVRPVLAELQRRRDPGDAVYVYYPSWQAIRFYGPRYGLGFDAVDVGACYPKDLHDYLRELDRYRGRKVWLLTAFSNRTGEKQAIRGYLDAIGVQTETIAGPPNTRPGSSAMEPWSARAPAGAYLYDLRDPVRLASTTAEAPKLAPIPPLPGVPRCVHGPVVPKVPTVAPPLASTEAPRLP